MWRDEKRFNPRPCGGCAGLPAPQSMGSRKNLKKIKNLLTNNQKYVIINYQMKEVLIMYLFFDADGIICGMVTLHGSQATTILETLEHEGYSVVFVDDKWDLFKRENE